MYPDWHFAKYYTSKMYKTVKTQTNLPVKICHLKVSLVVWRLSIIIVNAPLCHPGKQTHKLQTDKPTDYYYTRGRPRAPQVTDRPTDYYTCGRPCTRASGKNVRPCIILYQHDTTKLYIIIGGVYTCIKTVYSGTLNSLKIKTPPIHSIEAHGTHQ